MLFTTPAATAAAVSYTAAVVAFLRRNTYHLSPTRGEKIAILGPVPLPFGGEREQLKGLSDTPRALYTPIKNRTDRSTAGNIFHSPTNRADHKEGRPVY